jgi:hypothetical protein
VADNELGNPQPATRLSWSEAMGLFIYAKDKSIAIILAASIRDQYLYFAYKFLKIVFDGHNNDPHRR